MQEPVREFVTDMEPAEFRQFGHQIVDWIADYLAHPEQFPVLSQVAPGDIKGQLPTAAPLAGEGMDAILADFERIIVPGITHWNHPAFYAYFAITGSAPGILGEMLAAALNVNGMLWRTSPSATELEQVVLDWLRQMLGLPTSFWGIITDTASVSSMTALAAAREYLDLGIRRQGMAGRPDLPHLRVYISDQTHNSVEKGAILIGVGQENVVKIATDDQFRMRPDLLEAAIQADIAAGYRPMAVTATVGTTSTTSIDPVPQIAQVCQKYGVWLHVDGAYAASAAVIPEWRGILAGVEQADSFVFNPHKWLFTPVDCSVLYCQRPDVLKRAFQLSLDILSNREDDVVTNFMDYGVQLGRRFRALKLWFVLRYYGQQGLAERLAQHIQMAQDFAAWVDASPDWERLAPTPFSTVCFRAQPAALAQDEAGLETLNIALEERINATGRAFLSHTRLGGRYALRLAIGHIRTTPAHIAGVWDLLNRELDLLLERE
ncbi:MAG: aminotransferase class V-fold PLP-dependent enzyme [Anaerolineae bacterium]|nr:aminotransferase class V-fold PLP-dependent enzyme [Anaerolineae bacterium]